MTTDAETRLITAINFGGIVAAYVLLGVSLWLSTDVPLATKGFWGIAVLMLTISLVNFVKYRFDARLSRDRATEARLGRAEPAKPVRATGDKTA